jgi:hypothetical protein
MERPLPGLRTMSSRELAALRRRLRSPAIAPEVERENGR